LNSAERNNPACFVMDDDDDTCIDVAIEDGADDCAIADTHPLIGAGDKDATVGVGNANANNDATVGVAAGAGENDATDDVAGGTENIDRFLVGDDASANAASEDESTTKESHRCRAIYTSLAALLTGFPWGVLGGCLIVYSTVPVFLHNYRDLVDGLIAPLSDPERARDMAKEGLVTLAASIMIVACTIALAFGSVVNMR
jgi:hypothetical protein